MPLLDVFAANLQIQRQRKKLSQVDLAKKAGISVSYVSMLERAQRSPPLETIESLAKALDTIPTALLKA